MYSRPKRTIKPVQRLSYDKLGGPEEDWDRGDDSGSDVEEVSETEEIIKNDYDDPFIDDHQYDYVDNEWVCPDDIIEEEDEENEEDEEEESTEIETEEDEEDEEMPPLESDTEDESEMEDGDDGEDGEDGDDGDDGEESPTIPFETYQSSQEGDSNSFI